MQACVQDFTAISHTSARGSVRRRTSQRVRRAHTLRVVAVLAVALAVLVFAPRAVHTMERTNIPPVVAHTVAAGDTLWDIAARYSGGDDIRKQVAAIKRENALRTATVQPGQQLLIPVPAGK